MIWPLFRFWGRNLSNFSLVFLENLKKSIRNSEINWPLKETITESWEEEGEARLTTCCILERFQIIDTEMQRYKLVSQGPPSVDKSWLNNTQPERLSNATTGEVARLERSFNNEATTTTGNNRKKDNIVSGQRPTIRIQPHQGK